MGGVVPWGGRIFTFGVFGVEMLKQAPPSFRTDDGFALVTLNWL